MQRHNTGVSIPNGDRAASLLEMGSEFMGMYSSLEGSPLF